MAVRDSFEVWRGRGGDSSQDETTYVRVIRVWTDNPADDEDVVAAHCATEYGIAHGVQLTGKSAWCVSVKATNDLGPCGWLLTSTWSSKQEFATAPEDDPVEIEWDEEDLEVPVLKDRNGHAVLNSAGDFPDPLPVASDSILIATITFKTAASGVALRSYRKSINSDAFTIDGLTVNAKHARVRRIKLGKRKFRGSDPYRDGTVELAITDNDEDDWEIRWLDAGYRYLEAGKRRKATSDGDDTDPISPILLDGSGGRLASPSPATAVFNVTEYYRLKTFIGNIPGCETV